MAEALPKELLLQEFATAYEQIIAVATEAARRGVTRTGNTWGPREIIDSWRWTAIQSAI